MSSIEGFREDVPISNTNRITTTLKTNTSERDEPPLGRLNDIVISDVAGIKRSVGPANDHLSTRMQIILRWRVDVSI